MNVTTDTLELVDEIHPDIAKNFQGHPSGSTPRTNFTQGIADYFIAPPVASNLSSEPNDVGARSFENMDIITGPGVESLIGAQSISNLNEEQSSMVGIETDDFDTLFKQLTESIDPQALLHSKEWYMAEITRLSKLILAP